MSTSINAGLPDQGSNHRGKNWNRYEQQSSDLQDGFDLELINLSKRHQPKYAGPLDLSKVIPGLLRLNLLVLNNHRQGMTGIFEGLVYNNLLKRQQMLEHGSKLLDFAVKKKLRRDFHDLATLPAQGLLKRHQELEEKYNFLTSRIVTNKQKILLETLRRIAKQNTLINMNYFWTRLCEPVVETQPKNYNRYRPIFEVLHKLIIRDLSTGFQKMHNYRKDTFDEQAVTRFDEMMRYFVSNKLSEGFGSIQSFVMHFEVLKVEEIDQTDFMKNYGEAFGRALSEQSFDLNPAQEEKPAMDSIIAASKTLNVLDLNKGKSKSGAKAKK